MKELNVNLPRTIARFEAAMKKRFLVKTIIYEKVFRGKGLEFDSFRNYNLGDDASLIDWKSTMKAHQPLIKQYIEERALKVFFIVDVGDNMVFGSGEKLKNEAAAEISASLAHLITGLGDSIGFALYNDGIVNMRMPSTGIKQFYIFTKNLTDPKSYGGKSDLKKALTSLLPYLKEVSAVFIISDFVRMDAECEKILKGFSRRFETVGIMVRDPVDMKMPDLKREVVIEDVYTGEQLLINPGLIKHEYEKYALEQKKKVAEVFKKAGSDLIEIYTDKDFIKPLTESLNARVRRRKYIMPKR